MKNLIILQKKYLILFRIKMININNIYNIIYNIFKIKKMKNNFIN